MNKPIIFGKRKITVIPANLPTTTGVQPKTKTVAYGRVTKELISDECIQRILDHTFGVENLTEGETEEYKEDFLYVLNQDYIPNQTWLILECSIKDMHFISANTEEAKGCIVEELEDMCAESIGYFSISLIQEAFQRVRGHGITDSTLQALDDSDNHEEIGMLMQNTRGLIPEFVNVLVHKYGVQQSLNDTIFCGNNSVKVIINNKEYYYGYR